MPDQEYFEAIKKAWREANDGVREHTSHSDERVVITITNRGKVLIDVLRDDALFDRLAAYCKRAHRLNSGVSPSKRKDGIGTIYC